MLPCIEMCIDKGNWKDKKFLLALSKRAVDAVIALGEVSCPSNIQLSLLFTDNERMRKLNHLWRGKNKSTNVLSFPVNSVFDKYFLNQTEEQRFFIGDIALGFGTIYQESISQKVGFHDHLTHLLIHGFLHLLGYDHTNELDANIMETLEISALSFIGISNPYEDCKLNILNMDR